jgi:hypothetical protein
MKGDLWFRLYKLEQDKIQTQLTHILVIRGWAISVGVALLVAVAAYQNFWIALGGLLLAAFAYQESVYQRYLDKFIEKADELAQRVPVLVSKVDYCRYGPFLMAYGSLSLALIVVAIVVA